MKATLWLLVLGALVGCSSTQAAHDGGDGAVADITITVDTKADCGPDDAGNDPGCPARYGSTCTQPCSMPNLACAYPNVGDGPDSRGCLATAMMWCLPPIFNDDAGGATTWVCAQ